MDERTLTYVAIGLVTVAVLIILVLVSHQRARRRRAELQRHFGAEYDRTVQELGSRSRAERELAARERRLASVTFRDLTVEERARFTGAWNNLQAQFVDDPAVAVSGAAELVEEVMRARGYPARELEERVADISVTYPDMVQHYRAAHQLAESTRSGRINTEELRQAIVHYRFLFAELLRGNERTHAA